MITVGQLNQSILVAQQRILLYLLSDCSREIRLWWVLSLCLMLTCIYLLIKYSKRKTDSPLFSSTYFFHINGYLINQSLLDIKQSPSHLEETLLLSCDGRFRCRTVEQLYVCLTHIQKLTRSSSGFITTWLVQRFKCGVPELSGKIR